MPMTLEEAAGVLDMLERADARVWVDGGWAVDALVGRQTRGHGDLDLVVEEAHLDRAREALRTDGFAVVPGGRPWNFVMRDGDREVDLHVVRIDEGGNALYGPDGLMYPAGSLEGVGTIAGHPIRCVTPEFLMESRTGYRPDQEDVHDVRLLHAVSGVPIPPAYRDAVGHNEPM